MTIVATFFLILYAILFFYVLDAVLRGKFEYVLLFSVIFFPVYALFLAFNYDAFELPILVNLIQYSKEIIIFGALGVWISGQRNIFKKAWEISFLDRLFLSFLALSFIFFVLGVGEATFTNRAVYLKNILLIGIFYFFGRQIKIDFKYWDRVFNAIFIMTVLACGLVILENFFSTHFHSLVGYAKYNLHIKDIEPSGTYGLNFTFEAEGGRPRYGSFFSNPLEFSSSMLISVALSTIYLLSVPYKTNKGKYLVILTCAFICVLLAYSRASFVAFFLMLIFIAFLMRYYKILKAAVAVAVCIVLYISFFADDEVRYFVIDTLTFQNSSSLTHIVDWLKAVESMLSNPMGIGLAMSGNAGGVEESLIVGGENQYLIYGVQLGFLGALIYIGMLFFGIRDSWRAFRLSRSRQEAIIPFVAASVKFGLLLPLFTANAEAYIYVSLISWWFIGYSESIYQRNKKGQVLS